MAIPKRTARLRATPSKNAGAAGKQFSLLVPVDIGVQLEAAGKVDFQIEITADGLLYRPLDAEPTTKIPWLD